MEEVNESSFSMERKGQGESGMSLGGLNGGASRPLDVVLGAGVRKMYRVY